jgi:hypothetical protein
MGWYIFWWVLVYAVVGFAIGSGLRFSRDTWDRDREEVFWLGQVVWPLVVVVLLLHYAVVAAVVATERAGLGRFFLAPVGLRDAVGKWFARPFLSAKDWRAARAARRREQEHTLEGQLLQRDRRNAQLAAENRTHARKLASVRAAAEEQRVRLRKRNLRRKYAQENAGLCDSVMLFHRLRRRRCSYAKGIDDGFDTSTYVDIKEALFRPVKLP